jgi:hypothetical protein
MSVMTLSALDALAKGVDARFLEVFNENKDNYKSSISELFAMKDSDGAREHTKLISGAGELARKDDGAAIVRVGTQYSYETEYIHDEYAKGVTVTRANLEDRDWSDKLDEGAMLMLNGLMSMDKAKAQVFNGGFATTTTVNGYKLSLLNDAKPLFSTAHPRFDGGSSQSNASSTSAPLSESAVEDGLNNLKTRLTDDGVMVGLMGRVALVVPPALRKKALQITGSELIHDSANNAVNVYRGNIDVYECAWLSAAAGGSDTAWFLVVKGQSKLTFIQRRGLTLDISKDNNTQNRSYDVSARWSVGHSDWRFTYGSKGDNAAYSS